MPEEVFYPDSALNGEGIFGLPFGVEDARVVLIPVPWEATVSYRAGTAGGPSAILKASVQVDLFDHDTGRPYEQGIAMLPLSEELTAWNSEARKLAAPIIQAGGVGQSQEFAANCDQVNVLCEKMNTWAYETSKHWLSQGKFVGLVGGDHSTPYGLIRAILEKHPDMGILHLDAHADLRKSYEGFTWSHASIFYNVMTRLPAKKLVQVAIRDFSEGEKFFMEETGDRLVTFFESDLRRRQFKGETFESIAQSIVQTLPQKVYLSFDIDGLDPALCPNTGTPVPGGFNFAETCELLRTLRESGREIVGFDLSEVAAGPNGDEWDANVGARLLYKMIGWMSTSIQC
jgi:agmatinase